MDIKKLRDFLVSANLAGYAGGEEKKWIREPDGSTTIPFSKGDWRLNDNFFGGEPYGGRMVVFEKEHPVWIMTYYGWVADGNDVNPVYEILRAALRQMPEDHPYRGPREFTQGNFTYKNTWEGELNRFSGTETIEQNEKVIYIADYRGGEVDKRRGV